MISKLTHKGLQDLVVKHYNRDDSYVALSELREGVGYGANHEADVVAFGVWPSRGLEIIGHEIKVGRNDWLHELKDGAKAESIAHYCHAWILVTAEGVAKAEEIPARWGWWECNGKTLTIKKTPEQSEPKAMDRGFVASIMRNVKKNYVPAATATQAIADMDKKLEKRVAEVYGKQMDEMRLQLKNAESRRKDSEELLATFEKASGVYLSRAHCFGTPAETVGKCVRLIKDKGLLTRFIALIDERESIERRLREINEFTALLDAGQTFDFAEKKEENSNE